MLKSNMSISPYPHYLPSGESWMGITLLAGLFYLMCVAYFLEDVKADGNTNDSCPAYIHTAALYWQCEHSLLIYN